jgi:hypothetical protein
VVSNLRLQINQPADHAAASGDPGALSPVQGYAAHYCNFDREVDPRVVACSFITSGLRVFDVTDLVHPKEIGYYVAPTQPRAENGFMASDFAMSKPAIIPARREIWYSDGATGFNVLRVAAGVWPASAGGCLSRRAAIGARHIGRVRLGMKRAALAQELPAPRTKTARAWRWCVDGGGTLAAAFGKSGRVALIATTARAPIRRLDAPHRGGRSLVRTGTRLFAFHGAKVRYVAVAARSTLARPSLRRAYLHRAGL